MEEPGPTPGQTQGSAPTERGIGHGDAVPLHGLRSLSVALSRGGREGAHLPTHRANTRVSPLRVVSPKSSPCKCLHLYGVRFGPSRGRSQARTVPDTKNNYVIALYVKDHPVVPDPFSGPRVETVDISCRPVRIYQAKPHFEAPLPNSSSCVDTLPAR